jgi:hypothetical protein
LCNQLGKEPVFFGNNLISIVLFGLLSVERRILSGAGDTVFEDIAA